VKWSGVTVVLIGWSFLGGESTLGA
jgi:hypothetical protein